MDFGQSCDASILLKSKKEHYEKEVEKLISFIGEQYRANDPLSIIGKRFREKEEEFSNLRRKNQELLLETKNLKEDIQRLRVSRDSNIPWEDLHISLERTQKIDTVQASKEDSAFYDYIQNTLAATESDLIQVR